MEDLFEFLFGASGRINRAKYWRSFLIYIVAGLLAAVILFTAAGIAAPLFIIMVVVVLIPWLLWRFSITTERLHDRDKSGWWIVVFFVLPCLYSQFGDRLGDSWGTMLFGLSAFVFSVWGFIEMYCLRGSRRTNRFGPDPLAPRDTRPGWDQNAEIEMVPHKAGPPPVWRVKPGYD